MVNKLARDPRNSSEIDNSGLLEAETLRSIHQSVRTVDPVSPVKDTAPPKEEEKMSLFWRVFGGTILSIVALVGITIYNQMANSIAELRAEVAKLHEARTEWIKKDEFNTRSTSMWNRLQELQTVTASVGGVKEQMAVLGERLNGLTKKQEDTAEAAKSMVATLKERFVPLEEVAKQFDKERTQIQQFQVGLTSLQEKSVNRDEQMRQNDAERKSMSQEIQALRERLTKLEAQQDRKPTPASEPAPPMPKPMNTVARSPIQAVLTPATPIFAPAMFSPRVEN